MAQNRKTFLNKLTKERLDHFETIVNSEYTFTPARVAKISIEMVENARKRHAEYKDKPKQVVVELDE